MATCGGWGWRQPSDPASVASRTHRRTMNHHATALPRLCHSWRGGRQTGGSRALSAPLLHPVAPLRSHPHVHEVTGGAAQAQAATATCSHTPCPRGHGPALAVRTQMHSHMLAQGHFQPRRQPRHMFTAMAAHASSLPSTDHIVSPRMAVLQSYLYRVTHSDTRPQVTHAQSKGVTCVAASRLHPRHLVGEPVASPVI